MREDNRFDNLAMRYLNNRLTPAELVEFNGRLRDDPDARAWLWEIASQATALGDLARERATLQPAVIPFPRTSRSNWMSLRWALAAAAVVLLAGGLAWWWLPQGEKPAMTVTEVAGDISWSAGRFARFGLKPGDQLASGTVTVDGDAAVVGLQFADGTKLTLGGASEALIVTDPQKRVLLNRGTLFAVVTPQPPGRPMQVKTATAEAQVLGTKFSVTAMAGNTILNVEQGKVQLRRLADGQTTEVGAQQTASASLDASTRLSPTVQPQIPTEWQMDFSRPPGANWKGVRLPANGRDPARVRAIPCVAGRKADGTLVLHHGLTARALEGSGDALVALAPQSVVRLRWRTEKPSYINLFLSTHKAGGGFGGNFEAKVPARAGVMDAEGWRRMEVPLSQFRALEADGRVSQEGLKVFLLFINSHANDVGLEVAEVVISASARQP